jgi:hypothetical protein
VPVPRIHLFELEDQSWFPTIIRDYATDYLQFIEAQAGLHRPVVPLLADALRSSGAARVIDLCGGGGGPLLPLRSELAQAGVDVPFLVTDKFPNLPAFEALAASQPGISGHPVSIDATDVPPELAGFRTLFNAFHHFKPDDAQAVLKSAVAARQPIGVFEIPERTLLMIVVTVIMAPLMVLLTAPLIKPFRWTRLLFTYILPAVPLTCLWDGFVSMLRAYTPEELNGLAASLGDVGYEWRAGRVSVDRSLAHLTYLIGLPRTRHRS